jgi:hypothetical protein
MSEFFLNAHSIWQYVALAAVVIALVFSFQKEMTPAATIVYRVGSLAVGIQVLLGVVLWFMESGWSLGFGQGWLHPIVGIAAAGFVDVFRGRGVRTGGAEGQRIVRTGFIIVVVLVVAAIGIAEMA